VKKFNKKLKEVLTRHNVHPHNERIQYSHVLQSDRNRFPVKEPNSHRKQGKLFGGLPDWLTN